MISLPSADGTNLSAGLQIQLEKGWKTYWRSPGASGLPPQIDFSNSRNVASAELGYPIPVTFGDPDNLTAGYDRPVTFPIAIKRLQAGQPVILNALGIIGICAEICVPVQFTLELIENDTGISKRDIATALLEARSSMVGTERPDFRITVATLRDDALVIEAIVPSGTQQSTVLVEGPPSWYLTPSRANEIHGSSAKFTVSLKDIPADARPDRTTLTFTLLADGSGVESQLIPVRQ